MTGEGFTIIPISAEHQLAYACNVLNLGNGRIISVHAPSARQIVKHPAFKGDVQVGCGYVGVGVWVCGQEGEKGTQVCSGWVLVLNLSRPDGCSVVWTPGLRCAVDEEVPVSH
jgi:hypothetical protein